MPSPASKVTLPRGGCGRHPSCQTQPHGHSKVIPSVNALTKASVNPALCILKALATFGGVWRPPGVNIGSEVACMLDPPVTTYDLRPHIDPWRPPDTSKRCQSLQYTWRSVNRCFGTRMDAWNGLGVVSDSSDVDHIHLWEGSLWRRGRHVFEF